MTDKKSMTALVSAFSRAYHARNNEIRIFNDSVAEQMLTEEEFLLISKSLSDGTGFFNPSFEGSPEEALRWSVDNQLSPAPLGRAAFAEKSLERAVRVGARQYLIFGAGYDTFAYRQPDWAGGLKIFEIDLAATSRDKRERLKNAGIAIPGNVGYIEADFTNGEWPEQLLACEAFDKASISCCSILGVAYYLQKSSFEALISSISRISPSGSSVVFDYPDENSYTEKAGERAKKQAMLAGAANERMLSSYSFREMERLLSDRDFLIYEHLSPKEMTEQYFEAYNRANPEHRMTMFDNVNCCLAVKR